MTDWIENATQGHLAESPVGMIDIGSVDLYAGCHSDSVVACGEDDVESDWLDWVAEWQGR